MDLVLAFLLLAALAEPAPVEVMECATINKRVHCNITHVKPAPGKRGPVIIWTDKDKLKWGKQPGKK